MTGLKGSNGIYQEDTESIWKRDSRDIHKETPDGKDWKGIRV